jgi:hypothetical protein
MVQLTRTYVDSPLGQESNTTLRIRGLVLRQVFKLIVLILVVPNVAVTARLLVWNLVIAWSYLPLSGQIQHFGAVIPEGHTDTRDGVKEGKSVDGFSCGTNIPETELTITHLGETSRRNSVMFTHPDTAAVLGSRMTRTFVGGPLLARIPDAQLLITTGGYKSAAIGAPRQRLDDIAMLELQWGLASLDIPKFDRVVTRGGGKNAFSRRVEKDVSNFPGRGQQWYASRCPQLSNLEWPVSLETGATSAGSSASVWSVKPSGTFQMKTWAMV